MAANVVKFMLERLEQLLNKEEILGGQLGGLTNMRNELENMTSILRETDAVKDREGIQSWVKQIREIAYDIEDVFDDLMLNFGRLHHEGGPSCLGEALNSIKHLGTRRRIATEIQRVRIKLQNISMKRELYASKSIDEEAPANATRYRIEHHCLAALLCEEAELVGISVHKEELTKLVMSPEPAALKVISMIGPSGLGKKALIRTYNQVKGQFDCHAWISVTQSVETEELLRIMIFQLFEERSEPLPRQVDVMEDILLIEIMRRYLRDKRYVVVLDDVHEANACDSLLYTFPDKNRSSRILITTRSSHVGRSFAGSSGHTYDLQPLSEEEAWMLFSRKAFCFFTTGVCPQNFEDISWDIVRKCSGLPLVVEVIGGLCQEKKRASLNGKT